MDDKTLEKVWKGLIKLKYKPEKYKLEPIKLLTDNAPVGTFDNIFCLQLIIKRYIPKRDFKTRNWTPVFFIGNELLVGPSPELFTRIIEEIKYFERPEAFDSRLILQLHFFSLDFYKSFHIRFPTEDQGYDNFVQGDKNELVITGEVQRGGYKKGKTGKFRTRLEHGKIAVFNTRIEHY